jgi:hypothetical protein
LLVSALRDAAVAVAAADGSAGVVQLVDRLEPALFGRLALHVLTDVPDTDLVAERLTSRELFDNAEAFREYTLLLQHQFATLPTEIQQQVVRFIEAGPPRDGPPEAADRWRLRQLTRFGDALPADQQALHESLLERFGPPEDDDFEFLEFVGPTAPADAAALASMSDDDLLTMLATWTPDTHWRAPSREGLRLELEAAVQQDPARFAAVSPGFRDLDPTYGRGLLAGLTRAVSPGRASTRPGGTAGLDDTTSTETYPDARAMILWTPVLAFGQAVLDRPRRFAGQPPTGDGDRDPGWIWCRQQLADLLERGLRHDQIPLDMADKVLALLAQLVVDPEPDEEYERTDGHDDPATTAINTVRGCAILALIQFALWQHRHRPEGKPARLSDPVRDILEAHLDPRIEPTAAIRAVYGQWFRVLILCDPEWARSQVEKIFDRPDGSRLGAVAWESYLRFSAPVQQTYDRLSRWYFHSITALSGQQAFSDPASTEPDSEANEIRHHLVRHLAILYGQGIITVSADSLIEAFASHAPLELRAKFIEGLGISLHNTKSPLPAALDHLRQLWEWRLDLLRTTPDADMAELIGFGWWFSSDRLGVDWTVAQLQALLEAGGTVKPEHMVAEQLAAYRSTRLDKVVACLALLIDAATDRWFISGSLDSIRAILGEGIRGADPATRRRTGEIINRLVARGHAAFADLLPIADREVGPLGKAGRTRGKTTDQDQSRPAALDTWRGTRRGPARVKWPHLSPL